MRLRVAVEAPFEARFEAQMDAQVETQIEAHELAPTGRKSHLQ